MARHGASNQIIGLVAAFLTGRTMSVRAGNAWSKKRQVFGGVPQGSILGVLLFNITTDNLEDPTMNANQSESWTADLEAVDGRNAQSTPVQPGSQALGFDPG